MTPDVLEGPHAAAGRARWRPTARRCECWPPDVLAAVSETETSQGIVAVARRPVFDEAQIFRGTPLIVVGVGIQNPGNVGALLRTAEAAGATGAYLTAGSADPMSWKALRGSMGSAFRVPHLVGLGAGDVIARLAARGVTTIATASAASRTTPSTTPAPSPSCSATKGAGLPPEVAARADRTAAIPMAAPVESLNVAVAAGILLFEAGRQRRR